jgi:hypothetical protein
VTPDKWILEGLDRVGKSTLARGIAERRGYHLNLRYGRPEAAGRWAGPGGARAYQEASFRALMAALRAPGLPLVCDRSHLGEHVYAPLYRGYPGDYVFELEREAGAAEFRGVRLVLLVEDLEVGRHLVEDGLSLGGPDTREKRAREQALFLEALARSALPDKRVVLVTDRATGGFRDPADVLADALAEEPAERTRQ